MPLLIPYPIRTFQSLQRLSGGLDKTPRPGDNQRSEKDLSAATREAQATAGDRGDQTIHIMMIQGRGFKRGDNSPVRMAFQTAAAQTLPKATESPSQSFLPVPQPEGEIYPTSPYS